MANGAAIAQAVRGDFGPSDRAPVSRFGGLSFLWLHLYEARVSLNEALPLADDAPPAVQADEAYADLCVALTCAADALAGAEEATRGMLARLAPVRPHVSAHDYEPLCSCIVCRAARSAGANREWVESALRPSPQPDGDPGKDGAE